MGSGSRELKLPFSVKVRLRAISDSGVLSHLRRMLKSHFAIVFKLRQLEKGIRGRNKMSFLGHTARESVFASEYILIQSAIEIAHIGLSFQHF